jgi:membrane-associated phospholipid phosphatase
MINLKKNIRNFILFILLLFCSYFFFDARIALFIAKIWTSSSRLSIFSTNIPDFLFPLVCLITAVAWTAYFYLARRGIHNKHTQFFLLIANTIPLTFFLKSALKYLFGRINTRFWLRHPQFTEFHWFHGVGNYTGFPSGHMAVFTALALALWKFYPAHRSAYLGFLGALALALIATNYHFISDIIAGAYLGFIIHHLIDYGLAHLVKSKNNRLHENQDRAGLL